MGYYKLLWVVYGVFFILHEISGLNSKLDFGDDSKPSLVNYNQRSIPLQYEHVHVDTKKEDNLDKVGIVCTTNCDTQNSHNGSSIVESDVVVQIKSTLNVVDKSKKPEEVPDIAVVLGTKGSGGKNEYHNVERGLQFTPVSKNFQKNNIPLTPINVQTAFPSLIPSNVNEIQNRQGIEISMRTFPAGLVSLPDGFKYKSEGLEIKVPYFEPTYHKHYFGENSPPQYAYYPGRKSIQNPVAFNNIARPNYSFSNWNGNFPIQNLKHDENCICQNRSGSGLVWYPSGDRARTLTQGRSNSFGVKIDDKLASIN
ncbi:uncharacterized protein LOC123321385 [Coccinella septempunctata]|uniref:uncharacterized protein LOC123321385 n=1 Tax=Coccinella septempunctata TaxID=41139 RepID=UPI001D06109D|nr:uncharacterized protein LOC123321385 [Coccinella septempunctata]